MRGIKVISDLNLLVQLGGQLLAVEIFLVNNEAILFIALGQKNKNKIKQRILRETRVKEQAP